MKVQIFHKIEYKFVFCPHISGLMQIRGYFLDIDRLWQRFDIVACIVHNVVKELDFAEC